MRNLLYLVFILFSVSLHANYDKGCKYVIASGGLNMHTAPDASSPVVTRLQYGEKVQITGPDQPAEKVWVMDGDKKVYGYWTQAYTSRAYGDETLKGYVFDAYVASHMPEIPEYSLYYYDRLYITNFETEKTETVEASFNIDEDTYNYSAYEDCYQRYLEHEEELHVDGNLDWINDDKKIKEYLRIEKVDASVEDLRFTHNYSIDSSNPPEYLPYDDGVNTYEGFNPKQFFLPTDSGSEIHIKDATGEYDVKHDYVGYIPGSNQYVTVFHFEDEEYSLWDKTTGKRAETSAPLISPDGLLAVELDYHFYESGGQFYLEYKDRKGEVLQTLMIAFQTWIPDSGIVDAFWISNNELVFKAFPVDYTIEYDGKPEIPYEYIKVTVL